MRHLRRLRHDRQAQPIRDRPRQHGAVGIAGLLAEQDEVGGLALERLREDGARRDEIGTAGGVVADEHRAVRAHRERLAQRVLRLCRPHRDEDDLALAAGVLQPKRLLDGVCVKRVERPFP